MDWFRHPFAIFYTLFILKHYVADFLLQTSWMAAGKERSTNWIAPLAAHCAVHGALTGVIVVAVAPSLWWLAMVDFVVHATIDRSKGLIAKRFGFVSFTDVRWWRLFGADQSLHELTHLAYVLVLLNS